VLLLHSPENNYVYRTLQVRLWVPAIAAAALVAACLGPARSTTLVPSQTIKAGTRIACVLDKEVDSRDLKYGDEFKLRVVDTAHPALAGAKIEGTVTEVQQPSGINRARVRFFLTSIHFPNGSHKPISAYVVNRRVSPYNPAAVQAARNMPPPMPHGVTTPGPVAWQMNFGGGGPPTVSNRPSGTLGGTVYATSANEPIIVPAGTSVTIELQQDLTIP
jgi:hypothetical protein